MVQAKGIAAMSVKAKLESFTFQRRAVGPNDVSIDIKFCGICHSDIHQARDEWGGSLFPMVPGHEIVGVITAVGSEVHKFKVGETAAVGCMVDSCLSCNPCKHGLEQYCENGCTGTYNSKTRDGKELCQGGYSNKIVVRQEFVLHVPSNLDLAATAPLLCAGITTYSPLRHWKVGKDSHVGVVGLGGLGHMAVQLAHAMGATVTVFTRSSGKECEAKSLGASHVVNTTKEAAMHSICCTLDFIIDTVGAPHDLGPYIDCLKLDGTICLVGMPEGTHPSYHPSKLIMKRRSVAGSVIGGIAETQECLDFCSKHNIVSKIEIIKPNAINEAWERVVKSDVKYRFVIDMAYL